MSGSRNERPALGRRVFLKTLGLLGILAGLPSAAWAFFLKNFPIRSVEDDSWTFEPDSGTIAWPSGQREPYVLVVEGLVETPLSLTWTELRALPRVEQVSDFHCVEGWSVADVAWSGFRFQEIVRRAKPLPEAGHVVFHAMGRTRDRPEGLDHYVETLPMDRMLDPGAEILMVLDMDGRPLPHEHGAPLRVISPYDLGYKSIKFVTKIEITDQPQPGWWSRANPIYPINAPVPDHRLRKKKGT